MIINYSNDRTPQPIDAPYQYLNLLQFIWRSLGFPDKRKPLLIGIDGLDDAGKSSLALWLGWQLGIPPIHLDLYYKRSKSTKRLRWRRKDLDRALAARLNRLRNPVPIIVEGILLLDALNSIGRTADLLIFVEKIGNEGNLLDIIDPYFKRQNPQYRADFHLIWS